jgi:hypothetical protein
MGPYYPFLTSIRRFTLVSSRFWSVIIQRSYWLSVRCSMELQKDIGALSEAIQGHKKRNQISSRCSKTVFSLNIPMCAAFSCNVRRQKGISMHRFPKGPRCLKNLGNYSVSCDWKFEVICSEHLAADQFRVHLKMRTYDDIFFYFPTNRCRREHLNA